MFILFHKYFLITLLVLLFLLSCAKTDKSLINFSTVQVRVSAIEYSVDADIVKEEDTDGDGVG